MCCGGVFATLWEQLSFEDSPVTLLGWRVITDALSRGDNIEEGHYMERSGQILCRGPPTLCLWGMIIKTKAGIAIELFFPKTRWPSCSKESLGRSNGLIKIAQDLSRYQKTDSPQLRSHFLMTFFAPVVADRQSRGGAKCQLPVTWTTKLDADASTSYQQWVTVTYITNSRLIALFLSISTVAIQS